jgi:flavin-dependent dehydrogenase
MKTDIAIIGGGLAGLTAAISANRMGHSVVLIEKKEYPFHKVCGEYISLEAIHLLRWLGLPIEEWKLPILNSFRITHPETKDFYSKLPLGGIGISRYKLDAVLKSIAEKEGVTILQNTKVETLENKDNLFLLKTNQFEVPEIVGKVVLGAFGRNKPHFANEKPEETSSPKGFIGVKMHVLADLPKDRIELHYFPGGYCGISAIEGNKYCLCYLIDAQSVKLEKGDLEKVENHILSKNPELNRYLNDFEKVTERVSTAGVFFSPRSLSQNGMLFIGDSAGMIPPLAGNGMSMAMHAAIIAVEEANLLLTGKVNSLEMVRNYQSRWMRQFDGRLKTARTLQSIMQTNFATRLSLQIFNLAPPLFKLAAKATHGVEIPIPDFAWQKN